MKKVAHIESRAHIHVYVRDIPRTQFQSRLETRKIEAVMLSSKAIFHGNSNARHDTSDVRFGLVNIPLKPNRLREWIHRV
jgi:hypothetical protein